MKNAFYCKGNHTISTNVHRCLYMYNHRHVHACSYIPYIFVCMYSVCMYRVVYVHVYTVEDKKTFPFCTVERLKYAQYRFCSTVRSTVAAYGRSTVKERSKNC